MTDLDAESIVNSLAGTTCRCGWTPPPDFVGVGGGRTQMETTTWGARRWVRIPSTGAIYPAHVEGSQWCKNLERNKR